MKKITAVILAALAAASAISAGSYTLGDTDENGIIDGRDATLVLTEYAQTSTGRESGFSDLQNKAADVDENNIIDGRDASWILSYYAYISANGGEMDLRRFVKGEPQEQNNFKYPLDDITKSAEAFEYYADRMNQDILSGYLIQMGDCDNNLYSTYGEKEAKVALLLLNANLSFNNGVLSCAFEDFSDYDIRNGVMYLYRLAQIDENKNVNIDFNNYTMDESIGNYMNSLKNAAKIACETDNCDELNNVLYFFAEDENYQNLQNNYAVVMMTIGYSCNIEKNAYYETFYGDWLLNDCKNNSYKIIKKLINQSTGG